MGPELSCWGVSQVPCQKVSPAGGSSRHELLLLAPLLCQWLSWVLLADASRPRQRLPPQRHCWLHRTAPAVQLSSIGREGSRTCPNYTMEAPAEAGTAASMGLDVRLLAAEVTKTGTHYRTRL